MGQQHLVQSPPFSNLRVSGSRPVFLLSACQKLFRQNIKPLNSVEMLAVMHIEGEQEASMVIHAHNFTSLLGQRR